ncbi:Peroxisomal biogenesis factor 3 [Spathaspora sp. JA1]|nr:Peroxisomal biogenesis factor 3 [Spathaspora sp. JA1]
MAIFSSLSSFFQRHKKKILITTGITISLYYTINEFIIKKFQNYQNQLRQELIFKQQIKQRFIQTQQDCYYTILALLPVLTGPIIDYLPIELITQALRLKKNNTDKLVGTGDNSLTSDNLNLLEQNDGESKLSIYMNKSKIELWNLLKIKTITRVLTLMYGVSGLFLITKLQLNILARRAYLESAILMAGVKTNVDDINPHENYIVEQSYLSLSWWLLNKGWINLSSIIEALVNKKFEQINPKTELYVQEFEFILQDIINEINTNNKEFILANIFPVNYPDLLETMFNTNPDLMHYLDTPDSNLLKLVNETNSIILDNNLYLFELLNKLILTNLSTLSSNLNGEAPGNSLLLSGDLQDLQASQRFDKPYKLASLLAQLSVQNGIMMDNNNIKSQPETQEEDLQGFIDKLNNVGTFPREEEQHGEFTGNIYINQMNELQELDDFSASIYSNFE